MQVEVGHPHQPHTRRQPLACAGRQHTATQAGGDQAQHGVVRRAFLHHMRRKTKLVKVVDHQVMQVRRLVAPEQHEILAVQVGQAPGRVFRQGRGLVHRQAVVVDEPERRVQRAVGSQRPGGGQGQVQVPLQYTARHRARQHGFDHEGDARALAPEQLQGPQHIGVPGVDLGDAQPQAPHMAARHQRGQRRRRLALVDQLAGALVIRTARRCQCHATRIAVHQRHTDLLFQQPYLARQRGLGNVQHFRRAPQAAEVGHGHEVMQFAPVEIHTKIV